MARVTKCKIGKTWYLRFPREVDPEGKSRRKSLRISDAAIAEIRRREVEREINSQGIAPVIDDRSTMRYRELEDLFLQFKEGQGRARNTLNGYKAALDNFGCYLRHDVLARSITLEQLEGFQAARRKTMFSDRIKKPELRHGASDKTRRNELSVLGTMFKWAKRRKYIRENPAEDLEMPTVQERPPMYLTKKQEKEFLAAIDDEECRDVMEFYLLGGMRRDEGLMIRISRDIDLERGFLVILQPKEKSYRSLELTDEMRRVIERLILRARGSDRLIRYNSDTLTKKFKAYAKKAGLPVGRGGFVLHSLRHTYATRLAHRGVQFSLLQYLLGHKDPESTKKYLHPYEGGQLEALKLLQVEDEN